MELYEIVVRLVMVGGIALATLIIIAVIMELNSMRLMLRRIDQRTAWMSSAILGNRDPTTDDWIRTFLQREKPYLDPVAAREQNHANDT